MDPNSSSTTLSAEAVGQNIERVIDQPVPLSFPAVLRNPKLADRFSHLHITTPAKGLTSSASRGKRTRVDNEGKRWIRRQENARFVGNSHIVAASKRNYLIEPSVAKPTFPEPLPSYLSRHNAVPSAHAVEPDNNSANLGHYSLSLKGLRRELRKSGWLTHSLVLDIENGILDWLAGGTYLFPDTPATLSVENPGRPIVLNEGIKPIIREISRTPTQLIWLVESDSFARYLIHCCARYHKIVSFSKDLQGKRCTYLLRPNPGPIASAISLGLDTPPQTDVDYSSQTSAIDSETDVSSCHEIDSDIELHSGARRRRLSVLSEARSDVDGPDDTSEDGFELVDITFTQGHSTVAVDDGVPTMDTLTQDITSLTVQEAPLDDGRLIHSHRLPERSHVRAFRNFRATSSPSRSPARLYPTPFNRINSKRKKHNNKPYAQSFYDYLFA